MKLWERRPERTYPATLLNWRLVQYVSVAFCFVIAAGAFFAWKPSPDSPAKASTTIEASESDNATQEELDKARQEGLLPSEDDAVDSPNMQSGNNAASNVGGDTGGQSLDHSGNAGTGCAGSCAADPGQPKESQTDAVVPAPSPTPESPVPGCSTDPSLCPPEPTPVPPPAPPNPAPLAEEGASKENLPAPEPDEF